MVKTTRAFFLSLTILAFLLFSTVGTTTVYADDGTGTETETTTIDKPPVEETGTGVSFKKILEKIPDNTRVTVLNSKGEALSLASQASADALYSGYDPIWCPGTQVPTPGLNGCTPSFSSFTDLLTFLQSNESVYQGNGTIYIQQGNYLGGETEINFNNFDFNTFDLNDLTLQGGWDTSYDPAVDGAPTYTSTLFDIPIIIGSSSNPWAGSLTINDIVIDGVSGQTGLTLQTKGNIKLDEVEVTNSQSGADLNAGGDVIIDNSKFNDNKEGGADINAGGGVYVNFSEFNNNGSKKTDGYGLKIVSDTETSLYYISASNNEIFGADVASVGPVYIDAGFFNGNVSYSYNCGTQTAIGGYGLSVVSQGDIIVNAGAVQGEGIQANDNYFFGAHLEGVNVSVAQSTFNNNSSGNVENPVGKGLEVVSTGNVSLTSLEANNNQLFGTNIQAVGNVTVTNGFFNSNQGYYYMDGWVYDGYGLQVLTAGNIALDGVNANDNYLFGSHLEGAAVTVSNSVFSDNDSDWHEHSTGYGLEVVSTGDVTLFNVTANNNQRFGADIISAGEVNVTDSFFNGNTSYTYCKGEKLYHGYGLRIVTSDDAFLENVEAVGNYLFGAHIEANDVAIDTADFSNNSSNDALNLTGYGLQIISEVDVALYAITANDNQLFGADILAGDLVAIAQSYFNGHITYYYDYFSGEVLSRDGGYGLRVVTLGNIAIEDVTANNNYLYGAYIQGDDTVVENSSFTANGSGVITEPTGFGLQMVSTGTVSFTGVDASENQLFGADIEAAGYVSIVDAFFSGHQTVTFTPCLGLTFYGYGLNVFTEGDIYLEFVEANYNNLWGASLTGDNVDVYDSQFNNNVSDSNIFIDDTGLIIDAAGDVNLYNVEAKENRLIGATITAGGTVWIDQSTFTDNRGYTCLYDWCPEGSITYHGLGLQVTTPGLILVTDTVANDNNLFGAELNGGLVTVEDSTFNNNGMGNGLTVTATGNVTLTNVTALNNGGNGVEVNGVYCEQIVQVNGGTFADNLLYGLSVLNATLNLDGTQTFDNNGSGDFFNDTSTCVVVIPTITVTTQPTLPVITTTFTPDTMVGAAPTKSIPTGQYDKSKIKRLRRAGR